MEEHQERVVTELSELIEKAIKLGLFLEGDTFPNIPKDEQLRLKMQFGAMSLYSDILGARVEAFTS